MSVRAGLMNHTVLTLTSAVEEWGREGTCQQGGSQTTSLSRLQPMLHKLTGTLCVAVDFLGTKNCNKKIVFNTASKRGAKICPFYSGNCTKITKRNTQKKTKKKTPKSFSSNRYCLFTSHQNSLHLAACMKHFSLQTT